MKIESVAPVIAIVPEAKAKLDAYIGICKDEISGLGIVKQFPNAFLIEDIILFSQEVTGGTTDLDEETLHQFLTEAVQQDLDPSVLKLWWHSHVNGATFWSGIDTGTINKALLGNDWMISIVGNKKKEYRCRVDLYEPVRIALDELPLQLQQTVDVGLWKKLKAEIKEKVRKKKFVTYQGGSHVAWQQGMVWDYKKNCWAWPDEVGQKNLELADHACGECQDYVEGKDICKNGYRCGKFMSPCIKFVAVDAVEVQETQEKAAGWD